MALPALLRAQRIGEKAARVGFDWPDGQGARDKVDEELRELDEARSRRATSAHAERELGDVLFALVNCARKLELDPEAALRETLAPLRASASRGSSVAQRARLGASRSSTPAELDALWEEVKAARR